MRVLLLSVSFSNLTLSQSKIGITTRRQQRKIATLYRCLNNETAEELITAKNKDKRKPESTDHRVTKKRRKVNLAFSTYEKL